MTAPTPTLPRPLNLIAGEWVPARSGARMAVVSPRDGQGFGVRDVGSLNGTYGNKERIDQAALRTGDEVQIGKFRLVYYASSAS